MKEGEKCEYCGDEIIKFYEPHGVYIGCTTAKINANRTGYDFCPNYWELHEVVEDSTKTESQDEPKTA